MVQKSVNDSSSSLPFVLGWEEGIGDDKKFHIAHVSDAGLTLVRKLKDYDHYLTLSRSAQENPEASLPTLNSDPKAEVYPRESIERITFVEQLNQLFIFDKTGKRKGIPEGKDKPQAKVFQALSEWNHTESEEEADAWSVLKSPLFVLSVIAVIGGFFIYFTTICEPEIEATGRRAGTKKLLNYIGYAIGPFWMSVIVGSMAAFVVAIAAIQLIKRPMRKVLSLI